MDRATLNGLKVQLERERARLLQELAVLTDREGVSAGADGSTYATHVADYATETYDQERALALTRHISGVLDEVERALHKLENGSYGRCDSCSGAIDDARLEALPHASHCLACQAKLEAQR